MNPLLQKLAQLDIKTHFITVSKRFPLPMILIGLITILWLFVINGDRVDDAIYRLIMTGTAIFFLATSMVLLHEDLPQKNRLMQFSTWVAPVLFGIFFYLSIENIPSINLDEITFVILVFSGFFASLFVAPYIRKFFSKTGEDIIQYANYFLQVTWTILMGLILGGALIALGGAAISALYALFDINTLAPVSQVFGNWAVISLVCIVPVYTLINFPRASSITAS
jgi:hypothetical protein